MGRPPGSRWAVRQERPATGAVVLCSGSHAWRSLCLVPLKALVCQVPWWGPGRLLLEQGLACVAPGLHQGGILAAETMLSEVRTAPVHLRVPLGSRRPRCPRLLPVTFSLLSWEVGRGRAVCPWEPVLVPLRSLAPGSWLCSPVLLSESAVRKL